MNLQFLSTSDLHGYIYPTDFRQRNQSLAFGATKVKGLFNQLEQDAEGPLFKIDNGDFLQGSPLSYYVAKREGLLMADMMNAMGFDAGVLGNHEFNYGREYLDATIAKLNYPIVCANILNEEGQSLTGHPYVIFEKAGIKVALLGLTTPYIPHWEQPATVKGLTFTSAVETAKDYLPKLRKLADIIVVSYHGGFERDLNSGTPTETLTGENEGYQLLHEVPGIDILLTGHQHREMAFANEDWAFTQPGDKGRFIGSVHLKIDPQSKLITKRQAELIPVTGEEEPTMHQAFSPLLDEVETWLDQQIGQVEGDMRITDPMAVRTQGHPYINFIHQVQMDATGTDISGTALFDNNGTGFGANISMRDVVTNYIYPNTLVVLKVTGQELRQALERSATYFEVTDGKLLVSPTFLSPKVEHYNYDLYAGIDYTIDVSQPKGHRITRFDYHGQPIEDQQLLEIVVNQYRAVGGGDYAMFGANKIIREVTINMTELIGEYLQKHPLIQATSTTNFKLIY